MQNDSEDAHSLEFRHLIDGLEDHFEAGFKNRIDEINDRLSSAASDGLLIHAFLERVALKQKLPRLVGTQSFMMYAGDAFDIRINAWYPEQDKLAALRTQLDRYYSYNVLHNHNFHLFTVGLLGPGYRSNFFRCDDYADQYSVGDRIELRKSAFVQLSRGVARYIESELEFHIQFRPNEYSMSLNVIPNKPEDQAGRQYILDPESFAVRSVIE